MLSSRAPLAWFKALIMAENPMSRFSRSTLSATSSSENRADDESRASIQWSVGLLCVGERLPPDKRAGGDGQRVLPTTAKTSGDPLAVSSPVRPTSGATTAASAPAEPNVAAASSIWTFGGVDYAASSDATEAASNSTRSASGAVSVTTRGTDTTMATSGCS